MESILNIEKVGFKYDATWALKDIHLRVTTGDVLGIIGPNGSGKSTLLKIMNGLLLPWEGNVLLRDQSIASLKRDAIAREIAMVAQENYFRFTFSTLEVVLMGRFPHLKRLQFEGERDLRIALKALEATHSRDLTHRPIHELSGGERQRVLIARALAQEPRVILLDEPTSFLDLKYKREIFQLISSLSNTEGMGVVVVSHDIDLAAQYCRRLVMLRHGKIFKEGSPDEVVTSSNIETVYECPVLVDKNPATGTPRVSLLG
ncbi:MAG: ABC transporter ATP-binding protein [Deltaproteobacteria bacterium]|nr:ABC transporter ATP-binding protein [Deltaproteobacteria bacterium]